MTSTDRDYERHQILAHARALLANPPPPYVPPEPEPAPEPTPEPSRFSERQKKQILAQARRLLVNHTPREARAPRWPWQNP
jgi:hypothetical protein